jgi:hypothetical protein
MLTQEQKVRLAVAALEGGATAAQLEAIMKKLGLKID